MILRPRDRDIIFQALGLAALALISSSKASLERKRESERELPRRLLVCCFCVHCFLCREDVFGLDLIVVTVSVLYEFSFLW